MADATETAPPTWAHLVGRFAAHLEDEERAAHTVNNYRDDLHAFARWHDQQHGAPPDPRRIAKRDVLDWKQHVEATGGRNGARAELATVNRKLAAVRSFLRWAQDRGEAPHFEPPKPRRRQGPPEPRWLEKTEERALTAAVEAANSARDVAILYLGLHGGLRVSEMRALDWPDVAISQRKGELRVRLGKGAKQRDVKLSKTLRHALLDLGAGRTAGPVLTGQRGRLTVRGIQDVLERHGRAARVGKRVGLEGFSAHVLRHTCARRMLERGVNIADVAAHLGHSDVKVTMGYLAPKDRDLVKAVESLDED